MVYYPNRGHRKLLLDRGYLANGHLQMVLRQGYLSMLETEWMVLDF